MHKTWFCVIYNRYHVISVQVRARLLAAMTRVALVVEIYLKHLRLYPAMKSEACVLLDRIKSMARKLTSELLLHMMVILVRTPFRVMYLKFIPCRICLARIGTPLFRASGNDDATRMNRMNNSSLSPPSGIVPLRPLVPCLSFLCFFL